MDTRRLLVTLRQQVWLVLGLALVVLAGFVLLPELGKKVVYVSRAKILLNPSQRNRTNNELGSGMAGGLDSGNWLADEQTLGELLTSERLLSRVCSICNLKKSWQELRDDVVFEPLSVDFMRKVSLFSIAIEDPSPEQSRKLTQSMVQEFLTYVEELSAREFANTRRFLEELVAEAKEKVDDTEEKLLTITSSHPEAAENNVVATSLENLENEKRKFRDEVAQLEAEIGSVQSFVSGDTGALPTVLTSKSDTSLSQLQAAVDNARLKLLELEQLYTAENVQVVEQRAKLNKLQQLYATRCQQAADVVLQEKSRVVAEKRKQIQLCEARISDIRNRQLSPMEKRQVAKLERQLNMWEENHLNLVKQLYQARVIEQSSRREGAITILESPGLGIRAKEKMSRSVGARVGLGLPFSVGVAVAVVVCMEMLGASLRLVPKIESSLGVSVLAVIPPVNPELVQLWESYKREETLPDDLPSLLLDEPTESTGS